MAVLLKGGEARLTGRSGPEKVHKRTEEMQ